MNSGGMIVSSGAAMPWFGQGLLFGLIALIPLCILLALWVLLGRSAFLQGDDMERPSRVAQLYGYTVCIIAVIVSLVSANSLLENAITLTNPLQARDSEFGFEASVSSFESYRATYDRERQMREGPSGQRSAADTIPEAVLRVRYEALRTDRIQRVRFQAQRSLATSALSLLIAIALFVVHWRWLRSASDRGDTTTGAPKRQTA